MRISAGRVRCGSFGSLASALGDRTVTVDGKKTRAGPSGLPVSRLAPVSVTGAATSASSAQRLECSDRTRVQKVRRSVGSSYTSTNTFQRRTRSANTARALSTASTSLRPARSSSRSDTSDFERTYRDRAPPDDAAGRPATMCRAHGARTRRCRPRAGEPQGQHREPPKGLMDGTLRRVPRGAQSTSTARSRRRGPEGQRSKADCAVPTRRRTTTRCWLSCEIATHQPPALSERSESKGLSPRPFTRCRPTLTRTDRLNLTVHDLLSALPPAALSPDFDCQAAVGRDTKRFTHRRRYAGCVY